MTKGTRVNGGGPRYRSSVIVSDHGANGGTHSTSTTYYHDNAFRLFLSSGTKGGAVTRRSTTVCASAGAFERDDHWHAHQSFGHTHPPSDNESAEATRRTV